MWTPADYYFLLPVVGVTLIATVLSRFVRQSEAVAGVRQALSERSALLAKLFSCSRCLCFWFSLLGGIALSGNLPELVLYTLTGWFFSYQLNRRLDQRVERSSPAAKDRSCYMCRAPYNRDFLKRYDAYFCSYACWFEYLKSKPRPTEKLIGPSGEPIRQEVCFMPWKDIDAAEARRLLEASDGYVYLDVRSVPEFDNGHPAGAYNIPLFHRDQTAMVPNPDFLKIAQIVFGRSTRLIVGCQSGVRSVRAAELLTAAGFAGVYNLKGGFGGVRDERGQVVARGWFESGFPVEYGAAEGRSYRNLGVGDQPAQA